MRVRHASTGSLRRAGDGDVNVRHLPVRSLYRAVLACGLGVVAVLPAGPPVRAQELSTPSSSPPVQETPAAAIAVAPGEFTAGSPHVHTVAQGLTGVEGPLVWRVREVGLSATGAPESN